MDLFPVDLQSAPHVRIHDINFYIIQYLTIFSDIQKTWRHGETMVLPRVWETLTLDMASRLSILLAKKRMGSFRAWISGCWQKYMGF
jgi:hypothetical protein